MHESDEKKPADQPLPEVDKLDQALQQLFANKPPLTEAAPSDSAQANETPTSLLHKLESIRELLESAEQLSQEPPMLSDAVDDSIDDPIDNTGGNSLGEQVPVLNEIITDSAPADSSARRENPFLPAATIARLAAERTAAEHSAQAAVEELSRPPLNSLSPATSQNDLERRLIQHVESILQQVLDDYMPHIEAELRRRLNNSIQGFVEDFLKTR